MHKVNLIRCTGYIDFYVGNKFLSYKTKKGKLNYIKKILDRICYHVEGKVIDGIEIREMFINPNDFWKDKENILYPINDLGYSNSNPIELNKDKITFRFFFINLIGLVINNKEHERFINIEGNNFIVKSASSKYI